MRYRIIKEPAGFRPQFQVFWFWWIDVDNTENWAGAYCAHRSSLSEAKKDCLEHSKRNARHHSVVVEEFTLP